jgi:predicted metal-binding protein
MQKSVKIGIIICDRYRDCAGGKCFRSLKNRQGAFDRYNDQDVEVVGYTTCGGCPGGNVEYAPAEMKNNGATVIHFATGLLVGYPPCPYLLYFREFIRTKYNMEVIMGTHPVPQNYFEMHEKLGTWKSPDWKEILKPILTDEKMRRIYD